MQFGGDAVMGGDPVTLPRPWWVYGPEHDVQVRAIPGFSVAMTAQRVDPRMWFAALKLPPLEDDR